MVRMSEKCVTPSCFRNLSSESEVTDLVIRRRHFHDNYCLVLAVRMLYSYYICVNTGRPSQETLLPSQVQAGPRNCSREIKEV